ncbi:MAG: ADOP family duplicated permease [Vicinamibacteraceae bacterium]
MIPLQSELRQALRSLRRGGSSTAAAFLTLALGLGLTTALIAVLDGVLLRPLPYPDSEQLLLVSEHRPGVTRRIGGIVSAATVEAWQGSRVVEGPAAYGTRGFLWTSPTGADRMAGGRLSAGVMPILRVQPFRGRFFGPVDEIAGQDAVVILSHGLWMERFGGRDDAIGQRIRLDNRDYEVVGVAPPGFAFPRVETRLWTPDVRVVPDPARPQVRVSPAIARLRPGASIQQAVAEGTAAARGVPRSMVDDLLFGKGGPMEVRVDRMLDEAVASVKPALLAVAGGVLLLLLVACANVANLLLAAGVARRRELAVRAAMGASRGQLLRLMLVEHALLAAAGLAAAWLLATLVLDALPLVAPADFPRLDSISITTRVLAASGGAAVLTVLLAGLLPAWRSSRAHLSLAMKDDDGRSAGETSARLRTSLLVVEAALALVLVAGALLLVRTVDRLQHVDAGYDASNVLSARLEIGGPADSPDAGARRVALVEGVLRRLRALPGVVDAGAGNMAPFGDGIALAAFDVPGGAAGTTAEVESHLVTPGFTEALQFRVVAGRTFTSGDPVRGGPVLVNETFVNRYLRDGRPVAGRAFPVAVDTGEAPASIIAGVLRDIRPNGPRSEPRAEIYRLTGPGRPLRGSIELVVRTRDDPLRIVPALRDIVRSEDRGAAVHAIGTLAGRVSTTIAAPRFFAIVIGLFASLALALAAIGLYGVLSYTVTLRRRELGIRAALGAGRRDLLGLVLRQGLAATLAGLAIGIVLSLGAAWLMRSLLFGVEPTDVPSFAGAAAALLAVALVACLVPARRAASSDPRAALAQD